MLKLKTSSRELTKSEKIILACAGILGTVFLINTFILTPLNKKLKPLEEDIKRLEAQAEGLQTISLDIAKNEKELTDLKGKYEEASKTIPKTDRYPEVIVELEDMAIQSKVKIYNSSFGEVSVVGETKDEEEEKQKNDDEVNTEISPISGLSTFTVNLTLNGKFNDLMAFVDKLENDNRILEVQNFTSSKEYSTLGIVYYIAGSNEKEDYDFNNGSYGKGNLFE
ncbi:hypothetical protein [Clostridium chrysemydis]|uniref:hypothetical protein n=1 Tax=Clostridium chrysemydis TaxID=2665504 RepID=UPI001883F90D|nr:hypothetical protein [Clostridium chrysemydis]